MHIKELVCHCAAIAVSIPLLSSLTSAQLSESKARISQPVVESKSTILKGNTHPLARPEFDRGPAPPTLPLERMLLVLQRSHEQEAALNSLLNEQQVRSLPEFSRLADTGAVWPAVWRRRARRSLGHFLACLAWAASQFRSERSRVYRIFRNRRAGKGSLPDRDSQVSGSGRGTLGKFIGPADSHRARTCRSGNRVTKQFSQEALSSGTWLNFQGYKCARR